MLIKTGNEIMARATLADRMSRLEQQKARIAQEEAKIKTEERKARTRRLIEAGGLVEKAGLLDLELNTLYGALLTLSEDAKDEAKVAHWAAAGGQAFDHEVRQRNAAKEPLVVTFPSTLPSPFTAKLRALGLRWNKVLGHWEGMAEHDAVAMLVPEHNGELRRIRPPEPERAETSVASNLPLSNAAE